MITLGVTCERLDKEDVSHHGQCSWMDSNRTLVWRTYVHVCLYVLDTRVSIALIGHQALDNL